MATWRYVVSIDTEGSEHDLKWEIRELYPAENGEFGYTADPVSPYGNSYEELLRDLEHMRKDATLPVLDLRGDDPALVPVAQISESLSLNSPHSSWKVPGSLVQPRPQVVYLCGPSPSHEEMIPVHQRLTLAGAIALTPGLFPHEDGTLSTDQQTTIDELRLRKIELADSVFVVDPGGHTDESINREITYAQSLNKPIFRLSALEE